MKTKPIASLASALKAVVALAMLALMTGSTQAATYYWDSDGITPGLGNTAGTWGTSTFVATVPNSILNGTAATAGTATTSADAMYFGTMNLALGSTASTIGIVSGGITNNIIVFGAGQGSQGVTLSGGGGSITLAGTTPTITANNTGANTIGAVLAGTAGMTKAGAGTLTHTAANVYTGTTIVSGGGTLTIGNGITGSLNGITGTALTFNSGGGIFNVAEAASSTQGMGALTFTAGEGSIISTAAGASPTTATLTFASLAARTAGATANFSLSGNTTPTENKIVLTSTANAPTNSAGSNNIGIFFGGTDYARYDTTAGYIRAVSYGTDNNALATIGTGATLGINDATKDVKITGDITAQTTAAINTLNLAANSLTLQDTSQILSVNGILSAGAAAASIATAGQIQPTSSGGEMVIRVNGSSDGLSVAPIIQNNTSASSLTKSGAGTLTLSGVNTYTGTTTIDAGTLALSGGSAIADAGAVVLANAPGATLLLNANETIGSLSGGGFSGGNVNVGANTLTLANANSLTFGGQITGTSGGGLTISSGTLTLANKNTFAGTITLSGTSQLYLTYGSDGTSNTPTISSGGTISMGGGTFLAINATAQVAAGVAVGSLGGSASVGDVVSNPIIVTSGTATIKQIVTGGPRYIFSGGVTGGTSGAQTLSILQGAGGGNCERTTLTVSGIIGDGSGGTLGVSADFKSASSTGQGAFICLSGSNTFTGPIVVNNTVGLTYTPGVGNPYLGAWFVIGGEITSNFGDRTPVPGTGYLGGGNYANTISLATGTILNYMSSANQTLGGVISGNGNIVKEGTGTLTLSGNNTFAGLTTVSAGTLVISNQFALQNSTVTYNAGTNIFASGISSYTFGGLAGSMNIGLTNAGGSAVTLTVGGNNSSTTYSGILSQNGSLIKTGWGALTLSGNNTYSGVTTINAGTLQLGSAGAAGSLNIGSAISVASGATFAINQIDTVTQGTEFSGAAITGAGGFAQSGSGTTVLTNANSFTGPTTLSAGVLSVADASYLGSGNNVVFNGGTLRITGTSYSSISGGGHPFVFNPGAPVILDINAAGNTFSFDQSLPTAGLALAGAGTVVFQNSVSALTNNVPSGTQTYSGVIADGTGARSITKIGAGTQILSGANTYTGTTTINAGTLTLNRQTGSLSTSSALTFGGTGTFNMDNVGASGALTQTLGALTFSAGDGTVKTTRTAAQNEVITFASLAARTTGATANFVHGGGVNSSTNGFTLTSTANAPLSTGSNNPGIFFGGTEYARYDAAGFFRATGYGTDANALATVAAGATIGTVDAAKDVKITGAITAQTTASVNTINLGANTFTITAGNTLSVNGLLSTGTLTFGAAVNQGTIEPTAAGGEIVINANAGTLTLNSVIQNFGGGGTASVLTKSGAGTLTLSSTTSTYSGGTVLNSGTLKTTADTNLGSGGGITVNGTASWDWGSSVSYARSLTINEGAVLTLNQNGSNSGLLSGNGTITVSGSVAPNFSSTGSTFTGTVNLGYGMTLGNLGDSSNPINFSGGFMSWTGGEKIFALRPFILSASGTISSSGTGALVIQQPLAITGAAGARTLSLGGTYAATANQFNGNITDGLGSVISLTKSTASSIWALSGTNTYTGATTVSEATGSLGALIFQGIQALSPYTSLRGGTNPSDGGRNPAPVRILDDSASPESRLGVNVFLSTGNGQDPFTIFVGNNNTVNGGTSAGSTTGSTIQLGNMNFSQVTTATAGGALNVQGANGYKLQIANVSITLGGAGTPAAWNTKLNPTTAPLIVTGNVQQTANGVGSVTVNLQLEGTATNNLISGNILNSADGSPRALSVSKASTSEWILSGTNTYSGATTISGGTLSINSLTNVNSGASALGAPTSVANGTIAIGSTTTPGTLKYTGNGHTSDRVINLAGTTGGVTLDASGTGPLVLTSAMTATGAGSKTLTLTGSSTATNILGGAIVDNSGANKTSLIKTNAGTWVLAGSNTYSGTTIVSVGTLMGLTGGSCLSSAVTVTNTPGVSSTLGVHVTDSTKQWSCANLAFTTNGLGAQLQFSFAVAPSTSLAPLNITNNLIFTGAPVVVVNTANLSNGKYPLLIVGGATVPSIIPALSLSSSGYNGILSWGGTGNKTLFLTFYSKATLISFF